MPILGNDERQCPPCFQTKIRALGAFGLEPLAGQNVNLGGHCPLWVTNIVRAHSDVRFAPQSGRQTIG